MLLRECASLYVTTNAAHLANPHLPKATLSKQPSQTIIAKLLASSELGKMPQRGLEDLRCGIHAPTVLCDAVDTPRRLWDASRFRSEGVVCNTATKHDSSSTGSGQSRFRSTGPQQRSCRLYTRHSVTPEIGYKLGALQRLVLAEVHTGKCRAMLSARHPSFCTVQS